MNLLPFHLVFGVSPNGHYVTRLVYSRDGAGSATSPGQAQPRTSSEGDQLVNAPKPSDFTGTQRKVEAEKAAGELRERQGQIALAQQIEIDRMDTDVFDPTTNESLGDFSSVAVDLPEEKVIIRVVEDIEDMTFGAGTHYTFEVGKKYTVPKALADYLASIGYLVGEPVRA